VHSIHGAAMFNISQYYHYSTNNEKNPVQMMEGLYCLYPPYFTLKIVLNLLPSFIK